MNRKFTAPTRPRMSSGVASWTRENRITTLTVSAAPSIASASTDGASAGASTAADDARTVGSYHKGMVVFTVAKGGLMYSAAIAGQKFSYEPREN